jgi:hypothetical protein
LLRRRPHLGQILPPSRGQDAQHPVPPVYRLTAVRFGAASRSADLVSSDVTVRGRVEAAQSLSPSNIFRLGTEGIAIVYVSYLDASSPAHMRYMIRRLRRRLPDAIVILACWTRDSDAEAVSDTIKSDGCVTTLRRAVELGVNYARVPALPISAETNLGANVPSSHILA